MKLALELIEKIIKISGNPIIDGIIIAFIGFLSFLVAFGLVGVIFNSIGKYDSKNMSDAHWAIRLMVFLGLTFIFVKMAQFFAWIFSFKWWVYLIIICSIFLLGVVTWIINLIIKTINQT